MLSLSKSIRREGMPYTIQLQTSARCELVDITEQVRQYCKNQGIDSGAILIFSPHTTAGITLNENWDPEVSADMLRALRSLVPVDHGFRHAEGNSDAHIKATLTGSSCTVPVYNGDLVLGRWQGIYFVEYDGPRNRTVVMQYLSA